MATTGLSTQVLQQSHSTTHVLPHSPLAHYSYSLCIFTHYYSFIWIFVNSFLKRFYFYISLQTQIIKKVTYIIYNNSYVHTHLMLHGGEQAPSCPWQTSITEVQSARNVIYDNNRRARLGVYLLQWKQWMNEWVQENKQERKWEASKKGW